MGETFQSFDGGGGQSALIHDLLFLPISTIEPGVN